MEIIGVSGKAEHGKTYTCQILKKEYENRGLKVEIVPLAKSLKNMAYLLKWDGDKDENGRTLLQDLGKVLKNYHGGDCFARWAYEEAKQKNLDIMLIDDMRMLDEVEFFSDLYKNRLIDNYKLIRVVRPNYENKLTEEQRKDISETALDNYIFNCILINKGTNKYDEVIKNNLMNQK